MTDDPQGSARAAATAELADELARVLDEHASWLASAERKGSRADLSRAQLDGMDLAGTDLSGAVFRGASMNAASLRRTQLTHADFTDAVLQRADLSGADLQLADFSGADLTGADLRGTTPTSDKELGHMRRGPRFRDAILRGARLSGSYCLRSDFSGSQLDGCDLEDANLIGADLSSNDLSGARLRGADLSDANLRGSRLAGADLTACRLVGADLSNADLSGADVSGADLQGANFADTRVERIRYDRRARFRGSRVASCYGSSRFRRFAQDQDYIEEFKEAHPAAYRLWLVLTDCGRSMIRVVLWSVALTVGFGLVYYYLGAEAFAVSNRESLGWSPFTALYCSVVTFTTLGFGDVTPRTVLAATIVMTEVVVGYVMLGMLISILATRVARRS